MKRVRRLECLPGWAGVDEAGRGPLAGPVVAAAVVVPEGFDGTGIFDSKQLSSAAREEAASRILAGCCHSIQVISPGEIDRINILEATFLAMRSAVAMLKVSFEGVLVDGNRLPSGISTPVQAIVKGDSKYLQIAAAGILAKTHRDALMKLLSSEYPEYGFDRHFGYGTPEHFEAITIFGPCPIHRRTFSPVKEMLSQPCLSFAE